MVAQQSDLGRLLRDAAALADEILARDRALPGLAVATVRAVIKQLSNDDARALVGPTTPPKPTPKPDGVDVRSLIG